jgi:type I restriction enzyme, S subunit
MKQGWEIKRLGEVCDLQNGFAFKSTDYIEFSNTVNFRMSQIRPGGGVDLENNPKYLPDEYAITYKDYLLKEGDIVIAMTDMATETKILGVPTIVPSDSRNWLLNQRVGKLFNIDKSKVNIAFLKYILVSEPINDYYKKLGRGGLQINIGKQDILNAKIPLPPLPEQQRIVSILDEAFAAIANAKANAEQNLKNAKELFESYLQGVFENENWETKKWGELCDFVRGPFGGSLKKNVFKESGYVVYEQKHAIHDHFNQLRYFIDEEKFNEMKRFEVFPGDIIMSCSGVTLGRVAVVPDGIPKGIINQALLKLTPKKNVNVHFIKHWLRSSIFQKIIFDYSGGAAIPNVPSAKILKDIKIPCPSLKEQERIVTEIEIILNESKRLEGIYQRKIDDLEELKKSILQKAFAGELKTEKGALV